MTSVVKGIMVEFETEDWLIDFSVEVSYPTPFRMFLDSTMDCLNFELLDCLNSLFLDTTNICMDNVVTFNPV